MVINVLLIIPIVLNLGILYALNIFLRSEEVFRIRQSYLGDPYYYQLPSYSDMVFRWWGFYPLSNFIKKG